MTLKNAYTVMPDQLEQGDEMLFVVKAMVSKAPDGTIYYRLYRCKWEEQKETFRKGLLLTLTNL